MRVLSHMIASAMFLFPGVMPHQTSSQLSSVEKSKEELLELENHWLQVENDPDALGSILAPISCMLFPKELSPRANSSGSCASTQRPRKKGKDTSKICACGSTEM